MEFTYKAYLNMLLKLRQNGYQVTDYHDNDGIEKCVILRHDVDMSVEKALVMAELEQLQGVKSTYFVLLSTKFYNIAERKTRERIREIYRKGHHIGLHFDEENIGPDVNVQESIMKEVRIMEDLLTIPIRTVSMHRPSRETLESNYQLEGLVNSYGQKYFREFKYISDSRRKWRENVDEAITGGNHKKLHILTHPFWYNENECSMEESIRNFILSATKERYDAVSDNITDFDSVLSLEQLERGRL